MYSLLFFRDIIFVVVIVCNTMRRLAFLLLFALFNTPLSAGTVVRHPHTYQNRVSFQVFFLYFISEFHSESSWEGAGASGNDNNDDTQMVGDK